MKKVLVVDDSVFMRRAIKTMLEKNGFEVIDEAENGRDAFEKYKKCKPDIVTMDITMPVMSGIDSLDAILKVDKEAKIIMVSAMGQEEYVKNAILHGARYFIVKPFEEQHVVKILHNIAK